MSLEGRKITVMTDSPWIEEERSDCTPGTPLMAFSIGCVTSTSTCSAVSPGASRLNADLRRRELGEDVVLGARDGDGAVAQQQDGERHDDAAEAHGKADDGGLETARARAAWGVRSHQSSSPPTWICARNSSDRSICAPLTTIAGSRLGKGADRHHEPALVAGRHVGRDLAARELVVGDLDVDPRRAPTTTRWRRAE